MSQNHNWSYLKQAVFVVWAMLTVALIFCIAFLVYQMIQQGHDPLDITTLEETEIRRTPNEPVETTRSQEVLLYFASRDADGLAVEPRRIEHSQSTVANCHSALEALIQGPQDKDEFTPLMSPSTKVKAIYLLDGGELVIDFSREFIVEHKGVQSASFEALMVNGIALTLTQNVVRGGGDDAANRIRILVEGAPPQDSFPAHVDVLEPIRPDRHWVVDNVS